jgi:protein gp37
MADTSIAWTDKAWNPVRGCARVSAGCEHCYAERQAHRFSGEGQPYEGLTALGKHGPRWTGEARFIPEKLGDPLRWKRPQRIFVNSMSDLFHDDVTDDQIAAVFGVMAACPQHTFQILTKRPERMLRWLEQELSPMHCAGKADELLFGSPHAGKLYAHFDDEMGETDLEFPLPNVHLGVSCENQETANERVDLLLRCPAAVRWVSMEPLLEETVIFSLDGPVDVPSGERSPLDWIVVGGESGPGARPCDVEWIRSIVRQCAESGTACFVKQLGAVWSMAQRGDAHDSRDRAGGDPSEWPESLRVRQFPERAE